MNYANPGRTAPAAQQCSAAERIKTIADRAEVMSNRSHRFRL
ncbi:hypothetical protein [Aerosakkonema funiforme]|nr:hypothetical protein [Aerosakkonema funiforme]